MRYRSSLCILHVIFTSLVCPAGWIALAASAWSGQPRQPCMPVRRAGPPQSLLSLHAGGMGRGQPPQQQQPQQQLQGLPFGGAGPQPGSGNALLQLLQGRGAIGASGLPPALSQPQPQVTSRSLWLQIGVDVSGMSCDHLGCRRRSRSSGASFLLSLSAAHP